MLERWSGGEKKVRRHISLWLSQLAGQLGSWGGRLDSLAEQISRTQILFVSEFFDSYLGQAAASSSRINFSFPPKEIYQNNGDNHKFNYKKSWSIGDSTLQLLIQIQSRFSGFAAWLPLWFQISSGKTSGRHEYLQIQVALGRMMISIVSRIEVTSWRLRRMRWKEVISIWTEIPTKRCGISVLSLNRWRMRIHM